MIDFVAKLKRRVDRNIRQIESSEPNILKRALTTSEMLEEAFDNLKKFITGYRFGSADEEITFFKEIKPQIFCKLIFYRKVYYIEMDRPMGSFDVQAEHLRRELDRITDYCRKRSEFFRYYRSGFVHYDELYFMRGRRNHEDQFYDSFYFERDPGFSTHHDFTVAQILANDMLQLYLHEELDTIGQHKFLMGNTPLLPVEGPRWTDKKSALILMLYGVDTLGSFENGNISLKKLQEFAEAFFDISLGNISRAFNDMKVQNDPFAYLDKMIKGISERMGRSDKTHG